MIPIPPVVGERCTTRSGMKLRCIADIRSIIAECRVQFPFICVDLEDGEVITYRDDGRFLQTGSACRLDIVSVP